MDYDQYTRTKGRAFVPDGTFSRDGFYSPVRTDRRKGKKQDSVPDLLPYWQWRFLMKVLDLVRDLIGGRQRPIAEVYHYHRRADRWGKLKVVLTTLIAAPIVIIEIGFLLRFWLDR